MIIGVIISLLLFVLGVLIKYLNWDWLIAGYNTMSYEEKKNVDIEGLRRFFGNSLFILAVLFFVAFIFNYFGNGVLSIIMFNFFIIFIIVIVIGAQKYDLNKKENLKKSIIIMISIILISTISVSLIVYDSFPNQIELSPTAIIISGIYKMEIPNNTIQSVDILDDIPNIKSKVNGFDVGDIKKGIFKLEDIGKGRIYFETNKGPYIYIITTEGYVIINYKDVEKTRQIYDDIITNLF